MKIEKHLPYLFCVHIQHPIIIERQMGFRVSGEMDSTISQHLTPSTMHTWQCLMVYTVSRLSDPFLIQIGLFKVSIYNGVRIIKFCMEFLLNHIRFICFEILFVS